MSPMPDEALSALISNLNSVSFSDDKLSLIQAAAASNHFTISQTVAILQTLDFSPDKLKALGMLRASIVDPQNAAQLGAVFTFSSDISAAMQMFQ